MAVPDQSSQARQKLSLVSLVAVMVFVGLPLWWKTTEVYRSNLPYADIQDLQHKQVPPIVVNVSIVDLSTGDDWQATDLYNDNMEIVKHVEIPGHNVTIQCSIRHKTYDRSLKDNLREDILNNRAIPSSIGQYDIFIVDNGHLNSSSIQYSPYRYVTMQRNVSKNELSNVLSCICGTDQIQELLMEKSAHKSGQSRKPVRVKVSPGYQITMTIISPAPSSTKTNRALEHATNRILMPFIKNEEISMIGRFSISSQVIFYSDVHFKSHYSKRHESFLVNPSDLPSMISSIEAKLGSHVSQWPSLNFIIYIPEQSEWPLLIKGAEGDMVDAFLVPRWGGVILFNNGHTHNTSSEKDLVMDDVMQTVVDQLKLLLGLKQQTDDDHRTSVSVHKWDVDHLLIARAFESVVMATSSLHSLTSLLDDVKNMVISDHIQHEVLASLKDIKEYHFLSDRHEWYKACIAASSALSHSEAAFFDPSILALLYFPDDQKYAIYIPLFLPISVPVVIGVIKALKEFKKKQS